MYVVFIIGFLNQRLLVVVPVDDPIPDKEKQSDPHQQHRPMIVQTK
jgi:hypothetical protein